MITFTRYFLLCCMLLPACRRGQNSAHSRIGKNPEWVTPTDSNFLYFPLNTGSIADAAREQQTLDPATNARYSHVLFVLHEPDLSSYVGPKEAYRFTYITWFANAPFTFRITKDSNRYLVSFATRLLVQHVRWDGSVIPTQHEDSAVVDTSFAIAALDWMHFQDRLQEADFWNLSGATADTNVEANQYILEGTKEGVYHFAVRWSVSDDRYPALGACYDYLQQLAKKGDRHHLLH